MKTQVISRLLIIGLLVASAIACEGPTPTPQPMPTPTPTPVAIITKVDVPARQMKTFKIQVKVYERVEGKFVVRAGTNVAFRIEDPFGNVVTGAEGVSGTRGFAFIAATYGSYSLVFDNSDSYSTPIAVDLAYTIWWK